jgi:hypothetical protein
MLARITYVIDRASAQVLRFAQDDNTYLIAISIAESRLYRQGIHECIDRYTRFFPKWSTEGSLVQQRDNALLPERTPCARAMQFSAY